MVLEDRLTEMMFKGKGPRARAISLLSHLATRDSDRERVASQFCTVNGLPGALSSLFDKLTEGLTRIATGKSEMSAKKEVRIAFLEMLMRMSLGDRLVDKILSSTGGGSPQGPGSTPAPPAGAGTPQASGSEPTAASSAQAKTAEQVRLEIVSRTKLPYSDVGLRDKLRAFVLHLTDNPGNWQKVASIYNTIMVNNESTFRTFFEGIKRRILVIGHSIDREAQIDIAFLELVMRQALGNAPVDGVVKGVDFSTGGGKVGDLIRQWRVMIANEIIDITRGPLKPVTPANRYIHLVMIFNAITGEPVSVDENPSLPKPDDIGDLRAAIKIDYVQKGTETSINVMLDRVVANANLSDTSRSIITSLKDTLSPLGNTPTSASGNGGAGSTGAPPSGSGAPPDASNASAMSAARLGEPYGWMAPPPAREIRGIVREEANPAENEDTVEMELSDDEIAAAIAAEDDCAASAANAAVTSTETYLMATLPVAPMA
jgi:hypothetical protein